MICEEVADKFGIAISPGTIQHCVQKGKTGQALGTKGPVPPALPEETFCVLLIAFETCIQCNQVNGVSDNLHHNELISAIQRVLGPIQKVGTGIIHRLSQRSNIHFNAEAALKNEEQRTRWTTCSDVKAWFDNWRIDLEHLGFRPTLDDGSFHIPDNQLH